MWMRFWILITLMMAIGLTWNQSVRGSAPSVPAVSTTMRTLTVKSIQVAELVVNRECIEALTPGENFQVFVPLGADGKPVWEKMRTEGKVIIKFGDIESSKCQVHYNVRRIEQQ